MNPTIVIGLLLVAAAIALAAQDAYWRKREETAKAARDAERKVHGGAIENWRQLYRAVHLNWERAVEAEFDGEAKVARLTDEKAQLIDDLAWARLTIAVQAADADMRREMLGANVVPLRKGGA